MEIGLESYTEQAAVADTEKPVEEKISSIAPASAPSKPDPREMIQSMIEEQEGRRKKSRFEAKERSSKLTEKEQEEKRVRAQIREKKGPTEQQLNEWRVEFGHEGEKRLLEYLSKVPVVSVVDWEGHENIVRMPGKVYVARISALEDFKGTGDFALSWGDKEWLLVDLTVSTNPEILAKKWAKEKNGGPRVLNINYNTLSNASLGAIEDQNKVIEAIKGMVSDYKEERLQRTVSRL
ncbi:hypothetical protein A2380_02055 [candidate division WWE3 bacterium RIFOXYB1_FULL_43_24]|nr:MAG: hypothetical protein A2212_02995 [candidate division WWE3 bacterium RIFOXYA1_FULL_42_9]OGC69701.1 MAG: hypothetical protein A2380_02055 [candidate division WWE3 bacterium RIFOXYB1_FULL_43_24]OGC72616.1 MAG: hypothetical protein A2414_01465 [candidate division WWE3 bacterium RIFOXYC1_FULL_42_13]